MINLGHFFFVICHKQFFNWSVVCQNVFWLIAEKMACLLSHVSSMMSLVSCLLYHVSWIMSPVLCIMYHGWCLMSFVFCLMPPVSCLTSPVPRLLSHVFCLTSPVSSLLSPVSHLLSHVYCTLVIQPKIVTSFFFRIYLCFEAVSPLTELNIWGGRKLVFSQVIGLTFRSWRTLNPSLSLYTVYIQNWPVVCSTSFTLAGFVIIPLKMVCPKDIL